MNEAWAVLGPFALAFARLFGILRAHVLLRQVAGPAWWGIAAVLAIGLSPVVVGSIEAQVLGVYEWAALVLLEFGLGTVLGMILSFPGHALLGAARVTSFAALQGPRQKTVGALVVLVAACLGWALSLHHALLHAVLELAQQLPVANPEAWSLAVSGDGLARLIHLLCVLALALSTPVLLTAAVIDAVSRLTAHTGGADLGEVVRPWMITAGSLIALGASWSAFPHVWGSALAG